MSQAASGEYCICFFPDQEGTAGRSLSISLTKSACLFVPFARGAPYVMAHAHVTYEANEWMKELTKKLDATLDAQHPGRHYEAG